MVETMADGKDGVGWVQNCKTSIVVGEEGDNIRKGNDWNLQNCSYYSYRIPQHFHSTTMLFALLGSLSS